MVHDWVYQKKTVVDIIGWSHAPYFKHILWSFEVPGTCRLGIFHGRSPIIAIRLAVPVGPSWKVPLFSLSSSSHWTGPRVLSPNFSHHKKILGITKKYLSSLVGGAITILNNISQWEGLSHILWKIKHVWNHQPVCDVKQIPTGHITQPRPACQWTRKTSWFGKAPWKYRIHQRWFTERWWCSRLF